MSIDMSIGQAKDGARSDLKKHMPGWGLFAGGFAIGLVVVHLGITRPLTQEMTHLQRKMGTLETGLRQLAGDADKKTERLGTDLRQLALDADKKTERLGADLRQLALDADQKMEGLQDGLNQLAGQADQAAESGELLAALVEQGRQAGPARQALANIGALHNRIIAEQPAAIDAQASLATLQELRAEASDVRESANEIRAALDDVSGQIDQADSALGVWTRLNQRLLEIAADTDQARQAGEDLLALKEEILCGADPDQPGLAREALDEMVVIRQRLQSQGAELAMAQTQLNELLSLKDRVIAQTSNLAEAIETLEVASDLNRQFAATAPAFERIRRWLTDLAMLEPTIERAASMLKPLADLGALRRLSADELRQAARTIADERATRQAFERGEQPAHQTALGGGNAELGKASANPLVQPLDSIEMD